MRIDERPATELPGAWTAIRLRTFAAWILALAAVVGIAGLLISRTNREQDGPPQPAPERLAVVDDLEVVGDCDGLHGELDRARSEVGPPGSVEHAIASSLVRHVEQAMGRADCEIIAPSLWNGEGSPAGSTRIAVF